jgi:NitT/TauT family transport system substrate-binding protein
LALLFSGLAEARGYKLGIIPWAGYSPANVADVKGFWKKAGLDVQVFNLGTLQSLDEAFKNKTIDIGMETSGVQVAMFMEGVPLKIVAEIDWSYGGDKIVVKQDLDPAMLKSKPVGIYLKSPTTLFLLDKYLNSQGLKLADVTVAEVELEVMTQMFIDGQLSAIVTYDPAALHAEREGNGKVAATTVDYPGSIVDAMMIREDVLKDIPEEDLLKLFAGWNEAVSWLNDPANWKEYLEILNSTMFKDEGPYSEEDFREILGSVRIHDTTALLERNRPDGGAYKHLREMREFLKANQMLDKDFTPEALLDTGALVKALETAK